MTQLGIENQQVNRVFFDHRVGLDFDADPDPAKNFHVVLETPFVFVDSSDIQVTIDPENFGDQANLILKLLRHTCTKATASENGTLELVFDNGFSIKSNPHEMYEAWGIVGDGGFNVLALPGGGLAEWPNRNKES